MSAKKWYDLIPAEWAVNCLGFGKTYWVRGAWITFFSSIIIWTIPSLFITDAANATLGKAVFLVQLSVALFIISWIFLALYEAQGAGSNDQVVLDQFWGLITTFGLSTLAMVYAYRFSKGILEYTCSEFLNCASEIYYLGYLVGVLIPALMYFGLLSWRPWPMKWIDNHAKGSISWLLDDAVAMTYTTICYYSIAFLFMGGSYEVIVQFFAYLFTGIITPLEGVLSSL